MSWIQSGWNWRRATSAARRQKSPWEMSWLGYSDRGYTPRRRSSAPRTVIVLPPPATAAVVMGLVVVVVVVE